jgi:probable F420-dependent oxidoreductase
MTHYKASLQVVNQHGSMEGMRDAWRRADDLGADTIYNCDHFFPTVGGDEGPNYEAWTLLGAMAEVVTRADIGCLVSGNSYRNPNLLADMARTVDHISGGRLILGIGSGWMERDYVEYGYPFGTVGSRFRDLERDLPIIKDRLGRLNPAPVKGHIPLLIGGKGEKTALRIIAQHADIWHVNCAPDEVEQKAAVFDEWLAKAGRTPEAVERHAGMTPEKMPHIDRYVAAGFTHFNAVNVGPDWDTGFFEELLAWRDGKNAEEAGY